MHSQYPEKPYSNQNSPYLCGAPPGIGKSQVIAQAARDLGIDLIDVRAVLLDPVDLRGLPHIDENRRACWCPPDFLPREGCGVMLLDELNAAPPLVQAACYQLVLDRCLGEYRLPEGWSMVAAGNRETDRAVTHRMPSALANRFAHLNFDVDAEEWIQWAQDNGFCAGSGRVHPFFAQIFCTLSIPSGTTRPFPLPAPGNSSPG